MLLCLQAPQRYFQIKRKCCRALRGGGTTSEAHQLAPQRLQRIRAHGIPAQRLWNDQHAAAPRLLPLPRCQCLAECSLERCRPRVLLLLLLLLLCTALLGTACRPSRRGLLRLRRLLLRVPTLLAGGVLRSFAAAV